MIRKLVMAASAAALVGGSVFAAVGSSAGAATTITAGAGSSLNCINLSASVKLSPPLKDDWVKSEHSTDPNADVKALPNTPFAPPAPEGISGKGSSSSCGSSVAKQNAATATITKVALTIASDPNHGTQDPGSCIGLASSAVGTGDPSPAQYTVTIKYTATGAKVTPTTITHATIPAGTGDFTVSGGTVSGSFAGSTNMAIHATADDATTAIFIDELTGPNGHPKTATSASPAAPNVCQAALKIKTGDKHSAQLKKPKGLKAIGVKAVAASKIVGSR